MLIITKDSVYYVSGTAGMKMGESPRKVSWGKISSIDGAVMLQRGDLLQLQVGLRMAVNYIDSTTTDPHRTLTTSLVDKIIT